MKLASINLSMNTSSPQKVSNCVLWLSSGYTRIQQKLAWLKFSGKESNTFDSIISEIKIILLILCITQYVMHSMSMLKFLNELKNKSFAKIIIFIYYRNHFWQTFFDYQNIFSRNKLFVKSFFLFHLFGYHYFKTWLLYFNPGTYPYACRKDFRVWNA